MLMPKFYLCKLIYPHAIETDRQSQPDGVCRAYNDEKSHFTGVK